MTEKYDSKLTIWDIYHIMITKEIVWQSLKLFFMKKKMGTVL